MESSQPSSGGGSGAAAGSGKGKSKGMIRCPSCGAKNKDSFEYCVRCAEPLDEWAPEGQVAQGRALQAKLFTGAVVAIGILLLFAALKAAVAPAPDITTGTRGPTPVVATDLRPVVEPVLPDSTPKEALARFQEAVKAFNDKDYDLAISLFTDVTTELPENPAAFQYLGLAYFHSGRYRDAMDALEAARSLRPDAFELLDHYVTAAKKGGELEAALDALQDFVQEHPDARKAQVEIARIARELGNDELAVRASEELLTSGQSDPAAAYELGVSLKAAGRMDEAREAFRSAIELDPQSPAAYHALGVTELLEGNAPEAVEALEEAVSQAPQNGDFRFSLAQAYEKADRIPESLVAYEAYLEHASPDDDRARVVRERLEIAKKALAERNQRPGETS